MNLELSNRVQKIKPSPTLALSARAKQLQAEGKDILNLTAGEPDFDTPEHIKEAARKALKDGFTKYTPVDGTASLKQAIMRKFAEENKLKYEPKQIMVTNGAKQGIYNLMQALLNPGDEVIIPAPFWVSYPDIALLADAKPVFIDSTIEDKFKITPAQLAKAITPKTRLFIINSPSNPSGIAYSKTELAALGEVLIKHPNIMILTDDIYEHILWTQEPFVNIVNACPDLYDRTLVLNGVSKSYAMTGWRIGYAAGPQKLIEAMTNIQSQSTSNPNSIAQVAAEAALKGDQTCIKIMNDAYHKRHNLIYESLSTISGIKSIPADGTFYSFFSVKGLLNKIPSLKSDIELAEHLLVHGGVAGIPGSPFGTPDCLRLSFATSETIINDAIRRMRELFG